MQNRVRVTTGVTATENQAKRYINIALQDMHIGFSESLPWAERNAILITQAPYTTGTLTVSQGSTTITGTSTAWNTNNSFSVANMRAGGKIRINSGTEVYEIQSVASDTSATLTSRFTQSTVTDGTYSYFEDEYALASDFLRPIDQQIFSSGMNIELIGRSDFRRFFPRNYTTGKPTAACIIDRPPSGNTTPVRKVRFHKPPDAVYSIPYSYVTSNLAVSSAGAAQTSLSADADEPIVPLRYRHAIVLHALYHWYRDKSDDSRSNEAKAEYTDIMLRIYTDNEIGRQRPRLAPNVGHYMRKARTPYSGGSRRYDIDGRFDRFE